MASKKPKAELDHKLWKTNPQAAWVILVAAGWEPPGEYLDYDGYSVRSDHWHAADNSCCRHGVAGVLDKEQALQQAWRRFVRLERKQK